MIVAMANSETENFMLSVISMVIRMFFSRSPVKASTKDAATIEKTVPMKILTNHSIILFVQS